VRGKTGWITKPPFYPLNYGDSDNCDCRFSTANCKQRAQDAECDPAVLIEAWQNIKSQLTAFRVK